MQDNPDPIKKPASRKLEPEAKNAIKTILQELEFRRQLLGKKIPLSVLERPYKFLLK